LRAHAVLKRRREAGDARVPAYERHLCCRPDLNQQGKDGKRRQINTKSRKKWKPSKHKIRPIIIEKGKGRDPESKKNGSREED